MADRKRAQVEDFTGDAAESHEDPIRIVSLDEPIPGVHLL
jgi:hypothetical protein